MKNKDKIIQSAIAIFVGLASASVLATSNGTSAPAPELEKCYGIVKKGMNDCKTATASCAGSSTKDKQADAFIFLPKGTCDKIVDGSVTEK